MTTVAAGTGNAPHAQGSGPPTASASQLDGSDPLGVPGSPGSPAAVDEVGLSKVPRHTPPLNIGTGHAGGPSSLPDPNTASITGTVQVEAPSMVPNPKIRYTVIKSRKPELFKMRWAINSLSSKTVESLFAQVEAFIPQQNIQKLFASLYTSEGRSEYTLMRNDPQSFAEMLDDFSEDLTMDLNKTGNTVSTLSLNRVQM